MSVIPDDFARVTIARSGAPGRDWLDIVVTVSDQSVTPGAPRDVQSYPAGTTAAASAAPPTSILSADTSVTVIVDVTYGLQ